MLKIRKEFDLTADVPTVRFVLDYSLHYRAVGEQQLCTCGQPPKTPESRLATETNAEFTIGK